jgi:hypothetical protein
MKQTSNSLGPTKNNKKISVGSPLTPQLQIEGHQGKFQNQRAFYLDSVLGMKHSGML